MEMPPGSFGAVLDAIDGMPVDQQEEIVDIVRRRLRERERARLVEDVQAARAEHSGGEGKIVSVDDLMREINS